MLLGKCWLLLRRFAATIVGFLLVACTVSACDLPVPNVVDMALPDAIQKLENSGYRNHAVVDDHGMTILESHYEDGYKVTKQDSVGSDVPTSTTITLTVTESTIASPESTPSDAPSITSKPEVTPEPEPISEETTSEEPPAAEQAVDGPTPRHPRRRSNRSAPITVTARKREKPEWRHCTLATQATGLLWTATRMVWPANSGHTLRILIAAASYQWLA